jgi:hypothetical protein
MRRRTVQLAPVFSPCELSAESIDAERRTVEVIFLSGQPIARTPLFADSYWLEFDVSPKAANLDRLNAGAAVLDNHAHFGSVTAVLGRVERAWIAGGKARATLRFSRRPEVDGIWQDVADGILTSVSAGVFLEDLEELPKHKGSDMRRFAVRRWTPYEISIVGVPADAGAKIQASADTERHSCRLTLLGGNTMNDDDRDDDLDTTTDRDDQAERAELAQLREDRRRQRIRELATHFGCGDTWAQRHVKLGTSVEEAVRLAAEERAQRAPRALNDGGEDYDAPGARAEQLADALVARATRAAPAGNRYEGVTFAEAALEMLRLRHGRRVPGLPVTADPRRAGGRIVELALTSSDYPNLLANVANKLLLPAYELAKPTYRALARRRDLNDFKTTSILKVGDYPVPLEVGEDGEIQLGKFSEAKDTYQLVTYGRRVAISRQALVNDDLGAFSELMQGAARRAADLENSLWFAALTSASGAGPTLGDGVALFHTTHGNLDGSAAAIAVDSIGRGFAGMMKQTSLDGLKMNLQPRYLLSSPDKLTLARQHTTSITPAQGSNVNPFAGILTPLADANLTSANPWYLFADPAQVACSIYGYLSGSNGPRVATREGFEVEGTEMKLVLDFAFAFCDHRAAWRNPGV